MYKYLYMYVFRYIIFKLYAFNFLSHILKYWYIYFLTSESLCICKCAWKIYIFKCLYICMFQNLYFCKTEAKKQWTNEPMNQGSGTTNHCNHQWNGEPHVSLKQWTSEPMNQWTSESMNAWIRDCINQWMMEWIN